MTNYLNMIGLSLYMLIIMWWKFIIILPFLYFRRSHLFHKLRFAILGFLICYTVDLLVPRLFLWSMHWPFNSRSAAEWIRVWMIAITVIKIAVSLIFLLFLCKYYEKTRQSFQAARSGPEHDISIYQSNNDELIRYGIIAAVIGFALVAVLTIMSINRSTSSTAAIGYLFVPIESLIWSIPFFVFGISVGYLKKWYSSRVRKFNIAAAFAIIASIILFLAGAKFAAEGIYLTRLVSEIKTMNESELRSTLKKPFFGRNKFILGAIAQNKAASGELLDIIGRIDEKDLHERMWSLFSIMGDNTHGLAVMRLVARHPNVLPETLEHLAKSSNDYVLGAVAGNEKTSTATLIRLSQRKTYLIDWGLARNPSTPSAILSKLSASDNEYTRAPVAQNPSTPLKDIEKLSNDSNWNVRRSVVSNPKISIEILDKLSEDNDDRVRNMIRFNKRDTANIPAEINTSPQASGDHVAIHQSRSPQTVDNKTPNKLGTDKDFLSHRLASIKSLPFNEAISKPAWWSTIEAPLLSSEADVDRLWQAKPRCCIERSQLDRNNREFFKACYRKIESHPADERATVKCLWLMDIAINDKKTIKEYLIANYFDHKANTHTCANCAPGDIVAKAANDLSTQYELDGKIRAAIALIEKVLDQRDGEVSTWLQAELYTHLGNLYLILEVTKERQQRIENAYERLTLVKDHETLKQRYVDFERVYRQLKAQR